MILFLAISFSCLTLSTATQVYSWRAPEYLFKGETRRDLGYNPDLLDCGLGNTCVGACGQGFEQCPSSTNLALFCYNPGAGQTCCNNGDGRACDRGYNCAQDNTNQTWCCPENLSIASCAALYGFSLSSTTTSHATTTSPSTSIISESDPPITGTSGQATSATATLNTSTDLSSLIPPFPTTTLLSNSSSHGNFSAISYITSNSAERSVDWNILKSLVLICCSTMLFAVY